MIVVAGLLSCLATLGYAQQKGVMVAPEFSFVAPFTQYDADGERTIPDFTYGGDAVVSENYVRITPDRQNKRGWIWGRRALEDNDEWSLTLRFRISGQGKTLFGDGLALWVTQNAYHAAGNLHGFTDKFTGFGVIFDTFVNTEVGHVHKDVTLVHNDGTRVATSGDQDSPGCDSKFRWQSSRDDFNAAQSRTVVVVSYRRGRVSVSIDPRNEGSFSQCVKEFELPGLQADWIRSAHVGLTATTGDLADNHDVLSLELAVGRGSADAGASRDVLPGTVTESKQVLTGKPRIDQAVQAAADIAVEAMESKLAALRHDLEHEMDGVQDHLSVLIAKLRDAEQIVEERVTNLEQRIAEGLDGKVRDAISKGVDSHVSSELDKKVGALSESLHKSVSDKVTDRLQPMVNAAAQAATKQANDDLALPPRDDGFFSSVANFLLLALLLAVLGLAYISYKHSRELRKSHLP